MISDERVFDIVVKCQDISRLLHKHKLFVQDPTHEKLMEGYFDFIDWVHHTLIQISIDEQKRIRDWPLLEEKRFESQPWIGNKLTPEQRKYVEEMRKNEVNEDTFAMEFMGDFKPSLTETKGIGMNPKHEPIIHPEVKKDKQCKPSKPSQ